jgi:hypothetical protein
MMNHQTAQAWRRYAECNLLAGNGLKDWLVWIGVQLGVPPDSSNELGE